MSNTYQEIVERFEVIDKVSVDENEVITSGISIEGFRTTFFSSYKHPEVANEVAKKVTNFIGVR